MKKPNIVFIMSHDTGKYLGCYGEDIKTPNLDIIANCGAKFNNYISSAPVCGPARGALVTGRFINRSGSNFYGFGKDMEVPIPLHFRNNGYNTYLYGLYNESENLNLLGYQTVYPDGHTQEPQGTQHKAEVIMPKAADFIREYDDEKPFFLWVGLFETHRAFDNEHYKPDVIEHISDSYCLKDDEKTKKDLGYFHGSIKAMDNGVGMILNAIENSKNKNTILIFSTDHGIPFPLAKGTLYDKGINVSLLMMWKNIISQQIKNELLSNIDLFPTLCELCEINMPEDIDGKSFKGILFNKEYRSNEYVFAQITHHCRFRPERAIRNKKYKYIRKFHHVPGGYMPYDVHTSLSGEAIRDEMYSLPYTNEEFYDLEKDPNERNNLAENVIYQKDKELLNRELIEWMVKTNDPILFGSLSHGEYSAWNEEKCKGHLPVALW